ncbi:MAG: glycosyltransferase family 39 protein [Hyphomicrobiales bacterium]|nr:glycosyltransferase family 39 protein [Hyphomicrobiales bacterium]
MSLPQGRASNGAQQANEPMTAGSIRLIGAIERRPKTAFAAFLALHGVVWTALPALFFYNLPLDVIEAMVYGREWQLGYDKLPPLPWWLAEIVWRVFGTDASLYALCQVMVVIAFVAIWATARPLVGSTGALAACLIVDGLHYLTISSVKFNHNVIELPLWALAGFAFHAALKRQKMRDWILLGIALGLAFWAKYFVAVLVVPMVLFLLLDPDARQRLATPGPWIAAAVALIVTAPHLVWLVQHDFLPLHYVETRAEPARGAIDHLLFPLQFLGSQTAFLIPALLIAGPLLWPVPKPAAAAARANADAFDRRVVALLTFGPALTLLLASLISGRGTQSTWGYPLWLFLGLFIVMLAPAALERARLAHLGAHWGAVFTIFVIAFFADYLVLPNFDHRYRAAFFPGSALSAAITDRFEAATGKKPAYIIASMWDGGNVSHYSHWRPQPRVLIDGLPRRAPWINLADLRARGAVLVWTESDARTLPPAFAAVAPGAEIGTPFQLPWRRGGGAIGVGWAILRPQGK